MTGAVRSFSDFFDEQRERFVRACVLLTGSVAEGEDVAQEAMARLFERWDHVAALDDPEGYLYRTAMNVHRNAVRRAALAVRLRLNAPAVDEGMSDRRLDLLRTIRALPRAQREARFLVEWLGCSAEEAARMLGVKGESVRGRLHRARKTLRETYGVSDE